MLITEKVIIKLKGSNIKYYENLGYKIPRCKDKYGRTRVPQGTTIEVNVYDLPKNSNIIVQWKCDGENCNKIITGTYQNYNKYIKDNGKIYCRICVGNNGEFYSFEQWCIDHDRLDILSRWDKEKNKCEPNEISFSSSKKIWFKCDTNPNHESELKNLDNFVHGHEGSMECIQCNSFEKWCINNNRLDVLDRWDYDKNKYKPSKISYKSSKKCWFKCLIHPEHKSELKSIQHFTSGQEGSIACNQCNSIMQKLLDLNLIHHLDMDKNNKEGLDLWSISYGSNTEIWFKCLEKDYHGSYKLECNKFIRGTRCSYCGTNTKLHPLDSLGQYIIDNYGEDFLWKVWSNENTISPFEVYPGSNEKYWWNCPDGKHKPFLRTCKDSKRCDFRCPECFEHPKGKNHPRWNPNLTDEDRMERRSVYPGYNQFIKDVMTRDNYTCQVTGIKSNGHNLIVHHLNGYNWDKENRINPDNGIVLCKQIHNLFHKLYGKGDNTKEQFNEFLELIENGDIDISNIV